MKPFSPFARLPRLPVVLTMAWALAVPLVAGCAKDIPSFTPPAQREAGGHFGESWTQGRVLALAYHNIEDANPNHAYLGVRTDHLVEQLAWLHANGYQAVSTDQILEARNGGKPLPPRAIFLSFDDGYKSFYTRVHPILKAYDWPYVIAPVGTWLGTPANERVDVDFGGLMTKREQFLTQEQVRSMVASPLVELGAHTDNCLLYTSGLDFV